MSAQTDTLIVSGARCAWWDDISETANSGPGRSGIPLCPHCRSPLYQHEPKAWWSGVDRHEATVHPGYRAMIEWSRGRCFPSFSAMQVAYDKRPDQ